MSDDAVSEIETRYRIARDRAKALTRELAGPSLFERVAALPANERDRIMKRFSKADRARLLYHWPAWARPSQNPPPDVTEGCRVLFFCAGRGWGKSRAGAERVRARVYGGAKNILIAGPTHDDIVKYMLGKEGEEDGLLNVFHPSHRPLYVGKPHHVVRFHTGAVGYIASAEQPEARGGNFDTVWGDEIGKWRYRDKLWENIDLAARKRGPLPVEMIVTGTPLPLLFLKELIADQDTVTIFGHMQENPWNEPRWVQTMQRKYGGTRMGQQELEGDILGDNPDAFFWSSKLDADRVRTGVPPELQVVVAVDPASTDNPGNDECGIVVAGVDAHKHFYVLEDLTGHHKPEAWGKLVVDAYEQHKATGVVIESNKFGQLAASNVRAAMERKRGVGHAAARAIKFYEVNARVGKRARAEPVSTLHEQGMVHIVGALPTFESEITEWNPKAGGESPNRLDAMVWAAFHLLDLGNDEKPDPRTFARGLARVNASLPRVASTDLGSAVVARRFPPARGTARSDGGWGRGL